MRISDWSSDVCSSDLALMAGPPFFADPRVLSVSRGFAPGTAPWMQAIDADTDLRTAVTLARGTSATAIKIYADLPAERVAAITAEAHRQKMMISRSEEHTSELPSLMRISYAVFCLKKKKNNKEQ